ncbi:MAG: TIGR03808 family TAT-translocated repetitive protein, partial [Notoacmeibacter sp.]|nr:TIGR03808 family TAT-translocated repetitive protein [Notoacmeibacter sp.]
MLDRRRFLAGFLPAAAALAVPAAAKPLFENASMRGSIDAAEFGIRPGALDDQSRIFARMLEDAHQRNTAVFMPPGHYTISNINLPKTVRLTGVPGATRIVYTGNGHLFGAEETEILDLRGIVIDGQNRWLSDATQALIDARRVSRLVIDDCEIVGSGKSAITLEKCGGRIERTTISGAQDYAIYAVESAGLAISANTVQDCGNGGILVHRWQQADDGTIVSGNRLARIGARRGGTGQYGNGINVFRANGVTITGNTISDCAFSAIRSNSGSNLIVSNNSCLRSGETALYSEFEFEGAIVS